MKRRHDENIIDGIDCLQVIKPVQFLYDNHQTSGSA